MIRVILIIAAVMFSSVLGYHFGQQETELQLDAGAGAATGSAD